MPKLPIGDISPCVVIWDYEGGNEMHISPYLGKVALRVADSISDVHEASKGDAPVDAVFAGTIVELEVPMARSTLVQLDHMLTYERSGGAWTSSLSASGKVLTLKNMAGCNMYQYAKQIVIAPICNNVPNPDPHTWTLLYKCHPYRDFELGWDRSEQRVHMVKFKVFTIPNGGGGFLQEGVSPSPAPPTLLTAQKTPGPLGDRQIDLTWVDNSEDEDGFKIEQSLIGGGAGFSQIDTAPADATTYTATGLSPNTWYWYRIRAYNAYGNSPYSNEASAKTDVRV